MAENDELIKYSRDLLLLTKQSIAGMAIFERRKRIFSNRVRIISFVGIICPIFIGGLVTGLGVKAAVPFILNLTGIILMFQLILSVMCVWFRWEDMISHASRLHEIYSLLVLDAQKLKGASLTALQANLPKLQEQERLAMSIEAAHPVHPSEQALGYRAALIELNLSCNTCTASPTTLTYEKKAFCAKCCPKLSNI